MPQCIFHYICYKYVLICHNRYEQKFPNWFWNFYCPTRIFRSGRWLLLLSATTCYFRTYSYLKNSGVSKIVNEWMNGYELTRPPKFTQDTTKIYNGQSENLYLPFNAHAVCNALCLFAIVSMSGQHVCRWVDVMVRVIFIFTLLWRATICFSHRLICTGQ